VVGANLSEYYVPAGSLGFSVVVFIAVAVICFISLIIRRFWLGGELGGTRGGRIGSAIFFSLLWVIYVIMSIL